MGNGDQSLPKELIEVFSGGKTSRIFDFRGGSVHKDNKETKLKLPGKGHSQEVKSFLNALKTSQKGSPIAFSSLYYTTLTTFKILDSLATGLPQYID